MLIVVKKSNKTQHANVNIKVRCTHACTHISIQEACSEEARSEKTRSSSFQQPATILIAAFEVSRQVVSKNVSKQAGSHECMQLRRRHKTIVKVAGLQQIR